MKVANTRKVNERIVQYMSREQLNSLLGMGLSAPVSVDEIIFEEPDESYKLEYLKELLRDAEITRPEHVDYYMDYHNIINLICMGSFFHKK